jgi:lysophospholipase L1-like esterase
MGAHQAVLRACLAAMGASVGFPSLSAPRVALFGDSITAFTHANTSMPNGTVLTCDSSGHITAAFTNTAYGNNEVYLNDLSDATFELYGRNSYTTGNISVATARSTTGTVTTSTASPTSTGNLSMWNRLSSRGIFPHLNSLFQGGLELVGNYGHGGQMAAAMGSQVDYGLSRANLDVAFLMAGVNDIKAGGVAASTVFGYIQTLIGKFITAGIPVVVLATMPVGTGVSSYATVNGTGANGIQTLNSLLSAYVATIPTHAIFVDTFTPVYDSVNQCLYTTYTFDSLHPKEIGAVAMASPVYTALSPYITAPVFLPTSAADTGSVNGHTKFIIKGPWTTGVGGSMAAGCTASTGAGSAGQLNYTPPGGTGGIPSGWQALRGVGSPTATFSVFDPGDGKGDKAQMVVQPAAASDSVLFAPIWNSTLTTLGLVQGDEICIACEVDWTGGTASGLGAVGLTLQSNGSGVYGQGTAGETLLSAGGCPDSATGRVLKSGWMKINDASFTQLQAYVSAQFFSAGASPATINMRRFTVYKR